MFNFFKKKRVRKSWKDVTLKEFLELQDLLKIEDETERLMAVSELLLGEEVLDLPLTEFVKKTQALEFIKEPLPEDNPPKNVEVNGRKYYLDCLLGNLKTGQYIDYINHAKAGDIAKMLSVFIIPEGHKYNDGYDMEEVFDDINDLPIPVVNSAAFFFERQFRLFIKIFRRYSTSRLRKMKIDENTKKLLIEMVNNSTDTVLFHTS